MIHSATQLKAKIRNMSGGDSTKAQTFIRNYMMERFLERCAISKYRNNFILKGGMFVASYVGLENRTTMDIDTTVRALPLNIDAATKVIQEIIDIQLDDGISFIITDAKTIMEEHEYAGLRFMLDGFLDRMKQPIKIDISTDDAITPAAIEYSYPLMFEERTIDILTYNLETVFAEKMETILTRAEANTRMRDYYDIHILLAEKRDEISESILQAAFLATCRKRKTYEIISKSGDILEAVSGSEALQKQWNNYRKNSEYVRDTDWHNVIDSVYDLARMLDIL